MSESRRLSIRLSPRRHDVGAALMLKFRPKDGSNVRNRRLRGVDVLRACALPIICFAIAFVIKEQRGAEWIKPSLIAERPAPAMAIAKSNLTNRIAPDSPLETELGQSGVRLTHIEDSSDDSPITLPVSLSRELRVAEEEAPVEGPTASQPGDPSLRAALNLGDQALRSQHR
jgi:hypothetical protein